MCNKITIALVLLFVWTCSSSQGNDCIDAFELCSVKTYHIEKIKGKGQIDDDLSFTRCFLNKKQVETNSMWFRWHVEEGGELSFTITPLNLSNDFDFVLFRSHDGTCNSLEEVRCMASGYNRFSQSRNNFCVGATGLDFSSTDEIERSGCKEGDDNFLKSIHCTPKETYYLFVNNYNSTEGYELSFESKSTFLGSANCSFLSSELDIISVFPNPSFDILNMEYTKNASPALIEILSINGKILYSLKESDKSLTIEKSLNVKDLLSGTYFLRISQGDNKIVRSFVKVD